MATSRSDNRKLAPRADSDSEPANSTRRPLTTAEIAELAGVSIATVSKVLNGGAEVANHAGGTAPAPA